MGRETGREGESDGRRGRRERRRDGRREIGKEGGGLGREEDTAGGTIVLREGGKDGKIYDT